ncbi:hypothetical protein DENSPDRAFT_839734 [Dentipellis sp. KUC8613]|nr:hypothetical protein DENSPDRAFT_839734 [Dentipellis sp. KUC8613]
MAPSLSGAQSYWQDAAHSRMALVNEASANSTDAFSLVDDEITSMLEAIKAMRTFRNTFSPLVSKLLPEPLVHIFVLCIENISPETISKILYSKERIRVRPSWIALTQVCQHWRNIALQTPTLWTNLAGEFGDQWLWEMVERSKAAPVTFTSITSKFDKSVLPSIMHRVRRISIVMREEHRFDDIVDAMKTPAPLLECLELSDKTFSADSFRQSLPTDAFAGVAPHLRRLYLGACTFPLVIPISPIVLCLTELKISSSHKMKKAIPTPAEATFHSHLFSALPLMNSLENLTLIYCLPHSSRIRSHILDSILPLAKLKHFALCDDTLDCGSFLSHLRISSGTQVTLQLDTCYYDGVSIVDASESVIAALRLQPVIRQSFQTLMISLTPAKPPNDAKLGMYAWKKSISPTGSSDFSICFAGSFLGGSQIRQSLLSIQAICRVLSFEDIRHVTFNEQPCSGETELLMPDPFEGMQFGARFSSAVYRASLDILKGFAQLGTIQVRNKIQLSVLISALMETEVSGSFPGVHTLVLAGMDFSLPNTPGSRSLERETDNLLEKLTSCLRQRKALVAETKLCIMHCLIPEKWVQRLEQEVTIEWQGGRRPSPGNGELADGGSEGPATAVE